MAKKKPTKKPTKKKNTGVPIGRPKGALSYNQSPTCTLTQKILDEFTAVLSMGNFRHVARQRLGVSQGAYNKWIAAGNKQIRDVEAGRRPNLLLQGKFVLACHAAEGIVHGKMVEDILGSGSVQARMWYLERRFAKLYSRNPNAHVDDETGKEVKIDSAALLAEHLKRLLGDG